LQILLSGVRVAPIFWLWATLVVIGTDCTGSCKFNYHPITIATALGPVRRKYIVQLSLAGDEYIYIYSSISLHRTQVRKKI
jgi:hypothetical protein